MDSNIYFIKDDGILCKISSESIDSDVQKYDIKVSSINYNGLDNIKILEDDGKLSLFNGVNTDVTDFILVNHSI